MRRIFNLTATSTNRVVEFGGSMHSPRALCGVDFGLAGWFAPYFFENEDVHAITMNGLHYRNILINFLWPELEEVGADGIWFQRDCAACYITAKRSCLGVG